VGLKRNFNSDSIKLDFFDDSSTFVGEIRCPIFSLFLNN